MLSYTKKISGSALFAIFLLGFSSGVRAAEFPKDLYLSAEDVRFQEDALKNEPTRVYVTVHNDSDFDLSGVVKFYNERTNSYIGSDQPVSILSKKTDDVFIDWIPDESGDHLIAIRILPWAEGDNPDNNKVVKSLFVDTDFDGDGVPNRADNDDDNDGVPDNRDAFPFDKNESKDTDRDGIGDNADNDDDNDGVEDVKDAFPSDPNESKDTDKDGVGDNADAFPTNADETIDSDGDGLGDNNDPDDTNRGPEPHIQVRSNEVKVSEVVTFNALKTRDIDGEVVKYEWNFGDGEVSEGVVVDHVFKKPGDYYVTLKAVDDKGESREVQVQIRVRLNWAWFISIAIILVVLFILSHLLRPSSRFHHKKLFKRK